MISSLKLEHLKAADVTIVSVKSSVTQNVIFCRLCKVPLTNEEQFIGHQVISHELTIADAEHAWYTATKVLIRFPESGGVSVS